VNALAVSDTNSGKITVLDSKGDSKPIHEMDSLHQSPVISMQVPQFIYLGFSFPIYNNLHSKYSHVFDVTISIDEMGMVSDCVFSGLPLFYKLLIYLD
jgi:hypothetical protein